MKTPLVAAGLALTLLGGGCRKSDRWSCNNPGKNACSEWSTAGADKTMVAKQQASCAQMGGTVSQGPCPTASAVGSCVSSGGDGSRMVYYAPRTAADAQQSCTALGGTWKAPQ